MILGEADAIVKPQTKKLYKQAFKDGFWRGVSGKNAVVTYYPIQHQGYIYYQPYAKPYLPFNGLGHGSIISHSSPNYKVQGHGQVYGVGQGQAYGHKEVHGWQGYEGAGYPNVGYSTNHV